MRAGDFQVASRYGIIARDDRHARRGQLLLFFDERAFHSTNAFLDEFEVVVQLWLANNDPRPSSSPDA